MEAEDRRALAARSSGIPIRVEALGLRVEGSRVEGFGLRGSMLITVRGVLHSTF